MTEPPPWNDPIKPPNGNFSLEERKWREGITRALRNMKIDSLGDIGDVTLTSPTANQILKFDGTNWVNGSPSTTTVNWGDIAGTLSDQTDLKNALDAKQDISGLAAVALSGDYSDLLNTPSIPTVNNATLTLQQDGTTIATFTANSSTNATANFISTSATSQLTVDSDLIPDTDAVYDLGDTSHHWTNIFAKAIGNYPSDEDGLEVFSNLIPQLDGAYDLGINSNKWDHVYANNINASTGVTTPSLTLNGTAYTSIPAPANDATLTIQKNGTTLNSFTANASSNVTVNIPVPTDTGDLTNNAGFITGVSSLNNIGDVTISSPSSGDLLKYDGTKWINGSPSTTVTNWGDILGTLSNQTDLQNALNGKQATLPLGTIDSSHFNIIGNNTAGSVSVSDAYFDGSAFYTGNVLPKSGYTYTSGGSSSYWSNVYSQSLTLSSYVYFQTTLSGQALQFFWRDTDNDVNAAIQFVGSCVRAFDSGSFGSIDLGSSVVPWKDAYLAGEVRRISDYRLKENIEPIKTALDDILSLKPVRYSLKQHKLSYPNRVGFIAQEVHIPEVVYGVETEDEYLGIVYENMIPFLVKAIQELSAKIEVMNKQIKSLGG